MEAGSRGQKVQGPSSAALLGWAAAYGLMVAAASPAAEADSARSGGDTPSLNDVDDAAGADGDLPRRRLVRWNEYEGPFITMRLGGGFLWDFSGYSQDQDSESQMSLQDKDDLRDFRILLKGRFPKIEGLTYTFGYMYDGGTEKWRVRQTGLQYEIPKLHGRVFVGRTKEGISTNKLMVGYQGWTMERATINDALLPILADGIKWMGNSPDGQFAYSLGWFGDHFSEKESFNRSDSQFVGRLVWLPFLKTDPERLLHLAVAYRHANSDDGFLQLRSKPESFEAQSYAVDTGKFAAQGSDIVGLETYYRPGSWTFGMEYMLDQVSSDEAGDPFFHGGEIFAAYILTGETRPYNTKGAYFERISPAAPVFGGGRGAWEAVLRFSYTDMDSKAIDGGRFWRITPMLNWHMSDNVRLEFVYGYGVLDRFDTRGETHFFQTRIQLQL